MKETITIPKEEYDILVQDQMWLQALEEAGVDNWPGMGEANEIFKQWENETE